MSEVEVLREALRDTAERYVERRRRTRRAFAPLLVAACGFVALFAVFRDGGTRDEITATPTPTAVTTAAPVTLERAQEALAGTYSVFRRPAAPRDRVPARFQMSPRKGEVDWARARRIASLGGVLDAYAVPAIDSGQVGVCTFTRVAKAAGGGGCGPFIAAEAMSKPKWSRTSASRGPVYMLLLPDGVERVTVHRKDGTSFTRPVDENGFLYQGRGVARLSWQDVTGATYSTAGSP